MVYTNRETTLAAISCIACGTLLALDCFIRGET